MHDSVKSNLSMEISSNTVVEWQEELEGAFLRGDLNGIYSLLIRENVTGDKKLLGKILVHAASVGREDIVSCLLQKLTVDVNIIDEHGDTVLLHAIKNNQIGVVRCLLCMPGIDVGIKGGNALSPLDYALSTHKLDMALLLLKAGAVSEHKQLLSAQLRHAAKEGHKSAEFLARINDVDECGYTALDYALLGNRFDMACLLISFGATSNNSRILESSFMYAVDVGHKSIVSKFVRDLMVDVNTRSRCGTTALMVAVKRGRVDIIKSLFRRYDLAVNIKDMRGNSALMYAVFNTDVAVFEQLLAAKNLDVNTQDVFGNTALILAVYYKRNVIISYLLNHPMINIGIKNRYGATALLCALVGGCLGIVCMILDAAARSCDGMLFRSMLVYAVHHGYESNVLRLVLGAGIGESRVRVYGYHVLSVAISCGKIDMVKSLLADANVCYAVKEIYGQSLLSQAINDDYLDVAYLFLQKGFKSTDSAALHSALFRAVCRGDCKLVASLVAMDAVDVNYKKYGQTVLMKAAAFGFCDMVRLLLQAPGISVNEKSFKGFSALDQALENNHLDIICLMLEAGVTTDKKYLLESAMVCAVMSFDSKAVKMLLQMLGFDIEGVSCKKKTYLLNHVLEGERLDIACLLLSVGVRTGNKSLLEISLIHAASVGCIEAVRYFLLSPVVNVNAAGGLFNQSALTLAVINRNFEVVRCLLNDVRINIYLQDDFGNTALMYAVLSDDIAMVAMIVSKMSVVDVNLRNMAQESVYDIATEPVVSYLFFSGKVLWPVFSFGCKGVLERLESDAVEECRLFAIFRRMFVRQESGVRMFCARTKLLVASVCGMDFKNKDIKDYTGMDKWLFNAVSFLLRAAKLANLLYGISYDGMYCDSQYLQLYVLMLQTKPNTKIGSISFGLRFEACSFLVGEYSRLGSWECMAIEKENAAGDSSIPAKKHRQAIFS